MVRDYKREYISGGISNFKIDLFCVHIPKYSSGEKAFDIKLEGNFYTQITLSLSLNIF